MTDDLLELIQSDAQARLEAEPYFDDIVLTMQRDGVTEAELKKTLGPLGTRGGKTGACVLVLIPSVPLGSANEPGPRFDLLQSFVVLVHPPTNTCSKGTRKDATAIALRILALFHHASLGYGSVFTAADQPLVPNDSFDGLVGIQVNLSARSGIKPDPKVAVPGIGTDSATAPANVTLACGTAGASIHYTTDGSYPSSRNPSALLYAAPFLVATPSTVRAAAEKAGLVQSNVSQLVLA